MRLYGMSDDIKEYLVEHGCTIDGQWLLIPHRCQHLKIDHSISTYQVEEDGTKWLKEIKYKCDVHGTEEKPKVCKTFQGHGNYYIPDGCVYVPEQLEVSDLLLRAVQKK